MAKFIKLILLLFVVVLFGCGQQSGSDDSDSGSSSGSGTTTTEETETVSAILLSTTTSTIATGESATISARLLNSSGQLVTESKTVEFTLSAPALASINSPGVTASGTLNRTLTANNIEGEVTVTASVDSATTTLTIEISDELAAATVNVTTNPTTITVGGTSVVSAEVLDSNGDPMAAGTNVNFEVNNTALGTVVSSASISGSLGIAQATFSAGTTAGTATITATSGAATGSTTIAIDSADAGSIEFVSADPQIVVLKGSGGTEASLVTFLVRDTNGDALAGSETVNLVLSGPNGGEYIGGTAGVTSLDVGTEDGYAEVTFHSGTIPGTATITATVDGTSLSTSSGVIAIGGGVPSEGHFSLSTTQFNLEGLEYDGIEATINAKIADRYGNYNVLEGTSVSFYSECGAIDRSVNLDSEGEGSVGFRTQRPDPYDVTMNAFDQAIADDYLDSLGVVIDDTNNPRNGLCTIIAVVDGEEEFTDANADGLYDLGESFDDTYDDIHLDKDDDSFDIAQGAETTGNPYDSSFEDLVVDRFIDDDDDGVADSGTVGVFNGKNGVWDSNKRISQPIKLLFTGTPTVSIADSNGNPITSLSISDGGSATIYYSLHDENYNPPIGGTTMDISTEVGALTGVTKFEVIDTAIPGAAINELVISDSNPGDSESAEFGVMTFTWDWKGIEFTYTLAVTVD